MEQTFFPRLALSLITTPETYTGLTMSYLCNLFAIVLVFFENHKYIYILSQLIEIRMLYLFSDPEACPKLAEIKSQIPELLWDASNLNENDIYKIGDPLNLKCPSGLRLSFDNDTFETMITRAP